MVAPATEIGSSGEQADQASDIETLFALGKGAADDHVLDVFRLDAGALDQTAHHLGCEIVRPDFGELTLVGEMEGGAGVPRDHDILHLFCPFCPDTARRRG